MMRRIFAAVLLLSSVASAGERSAVSSLPKVQIGPMLAEPSKYGLPGVRVSSKDGWRHLEATSGYCFAQQEIGFGSLSLQEHAPFAKKGELWKLVEKDDTVRLEQTEFESTSNEGELWPARRRTTDLRVVAKENGVIVWAYRDATGDIVLIAKGATNGRELRPVGKDETPMISTPWSSCSFGAARIRPSEARAGTIVQLQGALEGEASEGGEAKKNKTRWIVDASLVKLTRDPEPVLSVRTRLVDK
jgi:hypothetical protein